LRGRKCPKCACSFTNSKESFVQRAKEIFGHKYDYSEVVYVGSLDKVKIICPTHGEFFVTPSNHLNCIGCAKCSYEAMSVKKSKTQEQFLKEATIVHGDRYGLEKVEYAGSLSKVTVVCTRHGDFLTQANSFLRGHGCPSCMEGGYSQLKKGVLYVMTAGDVCKVGITNKSAIERAKHVNKVSKLVFIPMFEREFDSGIIPIETVLLRELDAKYKRVEMKFNGSTECFYNVDQDWLLARINELIEEHTACQSSTQHQTLERSA
jgi:hypothetical protein